MANAGFSVHGGVWQHLQPVLPGLPEKLLQTMQDSLSQDSHSLPRFWPAYRTESSEMLPLHVTGHSLGGQLALAATIYLMDTYDRLSFAGQVFAIAAEVPMFKFHLCDSCCL